MIIKHTYLIDQPMNAKTLIKHYELFVNDKEYGRLAKGSKALV